MSACTPLDDGRACGDEGELCEACSAEAAAEMAYLKHVPKYCVLPPDEDYYQELRDAGRLPILEGLDDSEDFEDEEQPEDEYVDLHQDSQTGEWLPRTRIF